MVLGLLLVNQYFRLIQCWNCWSVSTQRSWLTVGLLAKTKK